MERQQYIQIVEDYFAALDGRRIDEVLTYFNEDAVFTVQSAFVVCERWQGIGEMFGQFLDTYKDIVHTDFEHIVDPQSQAISSRFRVELDRFDGGHETKQSVNQWYFLNGKFQRVYVWISGDNVLGTT
ncbi:MAG: nuclear transport factor 2 family protein [Gammaproteobacteria bacterium]